MLDCPCSLHSTMFSINPEMEMYRKDTLSLYIPLCFLLIKYPERLEEVERVSLHSTMFSINRGEQLLHE